MSCALGRSTWHDVLEEVGKIQVSEVSHVRSLREERITLRLHSTIKPLRYGRQFSCTKH